MINSIKFSILVCMGLFFIGLNILALKIVFSKKQETNQGRFMQVEDIERELLKTGMRIPKPYLMPISAYIYEASNAHKIDPALIIAIIYAESRGNHFQISPKGAIGMMQVMPKTAEEMLKSGNLNGFSEYDIGTNIFAGTAYLAQSFEKFNCISKALIRYNGGDLAVKNNYQVCQNYAQGVLEMAEWGK